MASSRDERPEHAWTFLSNYAHVLVCIARDSDITLRDIAARVGITERAVFRIIHELEAVGVITREREGRRNRYAVDTSVRLRHPLEADKSVGDLLGALLSRGEAATVRLRTRARKRRA